MTDPQAVERGGATAHQLAADEHTTADLPLDAPRAPLARMASRFDRRMSLSTVSSGALTTTARGG